MRTAVISSLLALALFSVSACPSESTNFTLERKNGRVVGHVRDDTGQPIQGARVRIDGQETITTADGSYAIEVVPEGSTIATFSAEHHGTRIVASSVVFERDNQLDVTLPSEQVIDVAFSGDTMFGRRYLDPNGDGSGKNALARANDPATFVELVKHVAPLMREADLAIPNVETAFAWSGVPHPSKPFVFLSPPTAIAALQALGADVASLANNHSYDFFEDGLRSTLDALHAAGIKTMGAGLNEANAYEPLVVSSKSVRVGLTSFCGLRICGVRTAEENLPDEPPYQDARGNSGGVAKLSNDKLITAVNELREQSDRVAVLLHSGDEYVQVPTTGQTNAAHNAIDLGADLVIGHHPHILQPFENYKGKLIAYSLGNLVFDQDFRETWSGAVLHVGMSAGPDPLKDFAFDPIQFEDYVPHPATGHIARAIVRHLGEMSAPFGVTVLEEGSRGRIVLTNANELPASEASVTGQSIKDLDGHGTTTSFEDALGPGSYISNLPAGADVKIGRDVLRVGSFEHELAGFPFEGVNGWNAVSSVQHLTTDKPKDGFRALQICRDLTATSFSGLYSAGRQHVLADRTYSLCGCFRGHEMTKARASVVYWDSIAADAKPVGEQVVVERAPDADWSCFCAETTPPPTAEYVNVRLEAADASRSNGCSSGPDQEVHCVDYDTVRLIEWQRWDGNGVTVPNRIDFVHSSAVSEGTSATVRTFTPVGAP